MNNKIETFGEVLSGLLKSKNQSIGYLSQKMQISSQTTISRILRDECSYEKIKDFYDSLIKINPLYLVEFERIMLEQAMEVNKVGRDIYAAKKEMMNFVNAKTNPLPYTRDEVFGKMPDAIQTLNELFLSYHTYEDVKIFIVNCLFDGVIYALSDCLEKSNHIINTEHYVAYEQMVSADAHQFMTLLPVLNHKKYNCYKAYFSTHDSAETLNRFQNMVIVLKKTDSGDCYTDLISICQSNRFSVLYNQTGAEIYNFYTALFGDMQRQHNPIKPPFKGGNLVDNITYLTESFLELEQTSEQVIIKPCFCFYSISGDVLGKLCIADQISGPVKNNLIKLHNNRFEIYSKPNRKHIGIYSKQGILEFLETGRFCDHLPIFRPFTKEEAIGVTKNIIKISENSQKNKIHLLKSDIIYNKYQYTLFNKQMLYFCNQSTDYTDMNFDYIINSTQVINVFSDFIEDELIKKHCHSAEESIQILKSYIAD